MSSLETYFERFRNNIVGIDQQFITPYGNKKIIYADWIASGRLYEPIEKKMLSNFGPFLGNTHSESSITGTSMTYAYHNSHRIIKEHVNATKDDVIITAGSGMTTVINKFQRILGLRIVEQLRPYINIKTKCKPLVFITHMEHHSNQTTWLESLADVVIIEPDENGLVDLNRMEDTLNKYKHRTIKIGSFSACSNVTGIKNPIHSMAKLMHEHRGICFADYAASAPYCDINMHPENPMEKLDAVFFSPHKFLGGPGTPGVLVFSSDLYGRKVPDHPGGGTVSWTNPWGQHEFVNDIEIREDGGTPGFLQSIKASLCIQLKNQMGTENINAREKELLDIAFKRLSKIEKIHILAEHVKERLGVISFYVENVHYNLMTKLLNDKFGIQVRGGCSCAGTYGHYLLHVNPELSHRITNKIHNGDLSEKPGWVRLSIHPTMTDLELITICDAIVETVENVNTWKQEYRYCNHSNEFYHKEFKDTHKHMDGWFSL